MQGLTSVLSFLNLLGLGGVGIFLGLTLLGLKQRLDAAAKVAEAREKIATEWERHFRERATDFEKQLASSRAIWHQVDEDRQTLIGHLSEKLSRLQKDLEHSSIGSGNLAHLKAIELEQLEVIRGSLELIPQLETSLRVTNMQLTQLVQLLVERSLVNESSISPAMSHLMSQTRLEASSLMEAIDRPQSREH